MKLLLLTKVNGNNYNFINLLKRSHKFHDIYYYNIYRDFILTNYHIQHNNRQMYLDELIIKEQKNNTKIFNKMMIKQLVKLDGNVIIPDFHPMLHYHALSSKFGHYSLLTVKIGEENKYDNFLYDHYIKETNNQLEIYNEMVKQNILEKF